MKLRKVIVLVIAVSLVAGVKAGQVKAAAVPEKWEQILAAAKKEGRVKIYGQVGPDLRVVLTKALKDDLGLDMDLVPGKGGEVAARFTSEIQAGVPSADILLGGSSTFVSVPELYNAFDKLEPLLVLPEVLDTQVWPNGRLPFLDKQTKLIPLVLQANQFLVVNTTLVKPGQIKSYRDLLRPQWKGKIVMYDPTINGTAQTWLKLILMKAYGLEEGEAFLRKFAAQEPTLTRDSRLQIEWVARGRYPLTVGIDSQAAYQMQLSGGPIARLATEEGTILTGGGSYMVMSTKRPHPNAAVAVLNWMLTARGQQVFSQGYNAPAARLGIKTEGVSPLAFPQPGEKLFTQDEEEIIIGTKRASEVARRVFGSLVKK